MTILDCVQGSPEWHQARCGSLGASQVADALARIKTGTGFGASRANVMAQLIAERLTGVPAETYTNAAMLRGTEKEPEARLAYEFERGVSVAQVGLILHPVIVGSHASPDGLIGDDGLVEIKCPNTSTHIETLLGEAIPDKYVKQIQWQLACSGRAWVDFVSYDDRLPAEMQLFTKRLHRDDALIGEMEREIAAFLKELGEKVASLQSKFRCAA